MLATASEEMACAGVADRAVNATSSALATCIRIAIGEIPSTSVIVSFQGFARIKKVLVLPSPCPCTEAGQGKEARK